MSSAVRLWLLLPSGILCLITVIGNSLVIATCVLANSHPTTMFIANLSIADLLVGFCVMPFAISSLVLGGKWVYGSAICRIYVALDVVSCTASIVQCCVISVDRFIGVTYPLQYPSYVTKRRAAYSCVGVWLISVLVFSVTADFTRSINTEEGCGVQQLLSQVALSTVLSYFIPLVIIIYLYYRIYLVTHRRDRTILHSVAQQQQGQTMCLVFPLRAHYGGTRSDQLDSALRKHQRTAHALSFVVGALLVFWMPFFVTLVIDTLTQSAFVWGPLLELFTWLGYMNSAVNPLIYGAKMRTFKNSFRYLAQRRFFSLKGLKLRSRNSIRGSMNRLNAIDHRGSRQRSVDLRTSVSGYSDRSITREPSMVPPSPTLLSPPSPAPPLVAPAPPTLRPSDFDVKSYQLLVSNQTTQL